MKSFKEKSKVHTLRKHGNHKWLPLISDLSLAVFCPVESTKGKYTVTRSLS